MSVARLFIILLLLPLTAFADFSVSLKAGSAGAGVEGSYHFDEQFAFRAAVNTYTFSNDRTISGIDYNYDFKLLSGALLLDIFPRGERFYFTGGLFINENTLEADAILVTNVEIGDTTYAAADVGNLRGDIDFRPISPYLGLGWRWRNNKPGISLAVEAGLLFHGRGDVTIEADGPISQTPGFLDDVADEIDEIEDQLGIAKLYPVIEAKIAYRF